MADAAIITRRFSYDDAPRDLDLLVEFLDQCKAACHDFKATVFAVPEQMRRRHWKPLHARKQWVHVGPHGFSHAKRECTDPAIYRPKLHMLKVYAKDNAWAKVFKSPWWGYSREFIVELTKLGFPFGIACIDDSWGMPMIEGPMAWNWNDELSRDDLPKWWSWSWHPRMTRPSEFKLYKTSISDRYRREYLDSLKPDDRFDFVEDIAEPLCVKLNIGCGRQVWPGWQCLDARPAVEGVRHWEWPHRIPYATCRADVVFASHMLEYLPESSYADLFLEVWRVLRPCGVFRLSDLDGYVWRPIGCEKTHNTGRIESTPTLEKVKRALWDVGFHLFMSQPGQTISPHKDVLQGDTRARHWRRGNKFYIDAVKALSVPSVKRVRFRDPHMTRSGAMYHVDMQKVVDLFFANSKAAGKRREVVK